MRSATKTAQLLRQLSGDRGRDGSSDGNRRGRAPARPPGLGREAAVTVTLAWKACRSHGGSLFRLIREAVSSPGLRTSPQRWRGYRTWLRNAMSVRPGPRRRKAGR